MTQFFDDQFKQEVTVFTPEMFDEIINGVRHHAADVITEVLSRMPDSPVCDRLNKYFCLFSASYHLMTCSLMHECRQLTLDEFKVLIHPSIKDLILFLQEAKQTGEMEKYSKK